MELDDLIMLGACSMLTSYRMPAGTDGEREKIRDAVRHAKMVWTEVVRSRREE